ncbi:1,4-dihydroxy-2-naphthoate polyprenyltransferase [Aureibaculum sp. 2210JD6-5]|uniref:1,4-dihydroxy-2-naphthoate polyprenyltransferase n=1 Tax=Aureibaculum sp. 2210JD6-5 TaxID=3103957 RepID=UPI002AAD63EB|nr:1,4-dihydroxy-2-naphthoate polyprenyltransferase [Aureibaculum sp. 2210JD6-5]MDY7393778.1 1,4-dihydroxy-2-naphthoate polyprenyltransferase [Aureibaculum sp. 2210JD6-5]
MNSQPETLSSKPKTFVNAARLRTLPLSISGIIVGSFLAYANGFFDWRICLLAVLTTVGFQVLSNFANDYGDGIKGTDNHERIGPQRALQSGIISAREMLNAMIVTGVVTFLIAILLLYISFGEDNLLYFLLFLMLGLASIAAAIKYTVGKKAYGYSGFGDVFVFLFFGWLSVVGSYFLYSQQLDWTIFLPATSIGLLSVGVLNLNNLRDRISDEKANKRTLVVKIGERTAKNYHYFLLITAFLAAFLYNFLHYNSPKQFIFIIAFIPIFKHLFTVYINNDTTKLDPELKKLALSTFLFSVLFGLGQIL